MTSNGKGASPKWDEDEESARDENVRRLTSDLLDACEGQEVEDCISAGLALLVRILSQHCEGDPYSNLIEAAEALQVEDARNPIIKSNARRGKGLN